MAGSVGPSAAGDTDLDREVGWVPNYPRARRIDAYWYRAERYLCGAMFLFMSLMVFAAVLTDIFGTRRSPTDLIALFGFAWLAVRTRVVRDGESRPGHVRSVFLAALITAVLGGLVYIYTQRWPGGFVWAQKLALVMMLWVALLGASMATYERAHLALELGEKIWPARMLHWIKAFAHAVTGAFCLVLLVLSVRMVADHIGWEATIKANDWLPYWVAVLIMPYTFAAMTVRLMAQTFTLATRQASPVREQLPT